MSRAVGAGRSGGILKDLLLNGIELGDRKKVSQDDSKVSDLSKQEDGVVMSTGWADCQRNGSEKVGGRSDIQNFGPQGQDVKGGS